MYFFKGVQEIKDKRMSKKIQLKHLSILDKVDMDPE